ncbi:hypothetical protein PR048_029241 [Dryococelus australis]|uniref:Uncharacterized protein n=1 Tax=Dryococelus australis TaxID=614101 RepID=A0ABQ9GFZ5_9NEOP|nr:hypothetical protein PR048_029241 [Dryococelus australis]
MLASDGKNMPSKILPGHVHCSRNDKTLCRDPNVSINGSEAASETRCLCSGFSKSEEEENETAASVVVSVSLKKKKMKRSTCWVREWIDRRGRLGAYTNLIKEMQIEDAQQYRNFTSMSAVQLQRLIDRIGPTIAKRDTSIRKAISVHECVLVSLRFLEKGTWI